MFWETGVQSQVKSYQRLKKKKKKKKKWYLIPPSLTLSIIRYGSRVKWSNPGNGVVAIEKGAFGSPWTKITNFTYFYFISVVQKNNGFFFLWYSYSQTGYTSLYQVITVFELFTSLYTGIINPEKIDRVLQLVCIYNSKQKKKKELALSLWSVTQKKQLQHIWYLSTAVYLS